MQMWCPPPRPLLQTISPPPARHAPAPPSPTASFLLLQNRKHGAMKSPRSINSGVNISLERPAISSIRAYQRNSWGGRGQRADDQSLNARGEGADDAKSQRHHDRRARAQSPHPWFTPASALTTRYALVWEGFAMFFIWSRIGPWGRGRGGVGRRGWVGGLGSGGAQGVNGSG